MKVSEREVVVPTPREIARAKYERRKDGKRKPRHNPKN